MKRFTAAVLSFMALAAIVCGLNANAIADAMHLHPPKTDKYDVGKTGLRWRNMNAANVTAAALYATDASVSGGLTQSVTSINSTNTTITAANADVVALVNMSGNHTLTLPDPSTVVGRTFRIVAVTNTIGTTGNYTLNATSSGNINTGSSLTVTNTSGATGAVSQILATAGTSAGYQVAVTRR